MNCVIFQIVGKFKFVKFVFYFFVIHGVQIILPEEILSEETMRQYTLECLNETNVDPVVVLNLKPDTGLKDWAFCMKSKIKTVFRNYPVLEDNSFLTGEQFAIESRRNKIKCLTKRRDRPLQTAWEYIECFNENSPRNYLVLGKPYEASLKMNANSSGRKYRVENDPWFLSDFGRQSWRGQPKTTLKIFPEDDLKSDRVIDQLMYSLPENEEVPIKKIYMGYGFLIWGIYIGRKEFIRSRCPVHQCTLTRSLLDFETADAVLFQHWHTTDDLYLRIRKRRPEQIWIYHSQESPYFTNRVKPIMRDQINWTASVRRDSDIPVPYAKWVLYDPAVTQIRQEINYAADKSKKVAWFVSNCNSNNPRMQYARELANHITVDVYGRCGNSCPRKYAHNCFEMLSKEYKFYLSFENANCQDYITEKFYINALMHDVLPVVMGARRSEYAAEAPLNSYIHVEDFDGPAELAAFLHRVDTNDTLYNSYFKWKGTGEFIELYFFCRLCAMLHAHDRRLRTAHYSDADEWLRRGMCTNVTHLWSALSARQQTTLQPSP